MKNLDKKIKSGIFRLTAAMLVTSSFLNAQSNTPFQTEQVVNATVNGKIVPVTLTIEKANGQHENTISITGKADDKAVIDIPSELKASFFKNNSVSSTAANICDSMTNILTNTVTTITYNLTTGTVTTTGYLGGTGPAVTNRYGEEFNTSASSATHIQWFTIRFTNPNASPGNPTAPPPLATDTGKFNLVVWDNSGPAGAPGAILSTIPVNYKTVRDALILFGGFANFRYSFQTPVPIPGNKTFFIGTSAGRMTPDTLAMGLEADTIGNKAWSNATGVWKPVSEVFDWNTGPFAGKDAHTRSWITIGITDVPVTVTPTPTGDTICLGSAINYSVTGTNAVSYRWTFQGGSITTSPSQTPSVTYNSPGQYFYNIQGFNSCGFSHSLFGIIRVDSLPPVVINSPPSVCNGVPTNISASGANTYVWDGPAITGLTTTTVSITPVSATTYSLTGTNTTTGCSKTVSKTIGITPIPSASFIFSVTDTVCPDIEISFDGSISSDETTYNWTFGSGTPSSSAVANPTVVYSTSGVSSVKLVVDNGCGELDSTTQNIFAPQCSFVGIGEQDDKKIKSYFDQSNSMLKITLSKEFKGTFNLAIYNNLGQLILTQNLVTNSSDTYNVQLPTLNKGIYYISLSDAANLYRDSFVH